MELRSSTDPCDGMVQNPLNLKLTLLPPYEANMLRLLEIFREYDDRLKTSLNGVYFIHFARFLVINDKELLIITTYDGDFYIYMLSFLKNLGWFFNEILPLVDGGAELVPVGENVEQFSAFARKNNLHLLPKLTTPYPGLTVLDIMNNAGLLAAKGGG